MLLLVAVEPLISRLRSLVSDRMLSMMCTMPLVAPISHMMTRADMEPHNKRTAELDTGFT